MATDFGDDAGDELRRMFNELWRKFKQLNSGSASEPSWLESMQPKAHAWAERRFRDDPSAADPHAQAEAYTKRTPFSVEMPDAQTASLFAAYVRDNGVWACAMEGEHGQSMLAFYAEDAQRIGELAQEWSRQNPEASRQWHEHAVARKQLELPPEERGYMRDIRSKVAAAREGAVSEADFIRRCEEQGLTVGRATDGELLFTHENGWFDVRGDTLGKEYTHDSFERGTGEKSDDLSDRAVSDQERYIQSHDGADIDASTRVVEHPTRREPDRAQVQHGAKDESYNLESEARDARSASKALDSNRGPKEIGPQER